MERCHCLGDRRLALRFALLHGAAASLASARRLLRQGVLAHRVRLRPLLGLGPLCRRTPDRVDVATLACHANATAPTSSAAATAPPASTRSLVPPHKLANAIRRARRCGNRRLTAEVPPNIRGQPAGRLIPAWRSFSNAFITIQSSSPRTSTPSFLGSVWRRAATATIVSALLLSRVLGLGGSTSRSSLDLVVRREPKLLAREWRRARQEFIQQHAQRIHVRPRIDVQASLGLLGLMYSGVRMAPCAL